MTLDLKRFYEGDTYTLGILSIDGIFECFTLEDKVRAVKVAGSTAIGEGSYEVTVDMSQRFGCLMPHVLNVPNFDGIRIHSGNTAKDTEGCILVGLTCEKSGFIGKSRPAFDSFYPKLIQGIEDAKNSGQKVTIFIHS